MTQVPPGQPLGYVKYLHDADLWPPDQIVEQWGPYCATAFLVIAAQPGDNGTRPLTGDATLHNASLAILDAAGASVSQPTAGATYTLRCTVTNLGAAGAYAGLLEFYVAQPAALEQAALTPGARLPALGYTGFVAPPGATVTVDCPRPWTPASTQEAQQSVLVHVFDPLFDRVIRPYDAREDRHVGRLDTVPIPRAVLIPYLADDYHYLVVPSGSNAGFEQPGFDDRAFAVGPAGFGTQSGSCSLNNPTTARTPWPINTDLLLRKDFSLPAGSANLEVRVAIDNDVQVFINGQDISRGLRVHENCAERDSFVFAAPDRLLQTGRNLLAVRASDRGGLSYVDVQVSAT